MGTQGGVWATMLRSISSLFLNKVMHSMTHLPRPHDRRSQRYLIYLAPTRCRCTRGQTETVQKPLPTIKHYVRCVWQPNLMSIASCIPEILKGV